MIDLSRTIVPKSDQLNADDLIGGPRTIRVTRVSVKEGEDQPTAIHFEGDDGKPYKPCKSMRRVLVRVWGTDGTAYAGRRMTLYRDEAVQFGGMAVGGIRISHVSGIDQRLTMPLTATRAKRVAYTVQPLPDDRGQNGSKPKSGRERLLDAARAAAANGSQSLADFRDGLTNQQDDALAPILDEIKRTAAHADDRTGDTDPDRFPGEDAIEGEAA